MVLLDTDILIDVALDRIPFSEPAANVLDWCEQNPKQGYIAWHSVANFYYLVRPSRGHDDTKNYILELIKFVEVAKAGTAEVAIAARLGMRDFEDALQVAAALACGADAIITRNVRDDRQAPISAMTPAEFVTQCNDD